MSSDKKKARKGDDAGPSGRASPQPPPKDNSYGLAKELPKLDCKDFNLHVNAVCDYIRERIRLENSCKWHGPGVAFLVYCLLS